MSLVNKMLVDLEERHSYFKDHDQIVLGGLTPVSDTGFSAPKLPYNFLIVSFFLTAIAVAGYAFIRGPSGNVIIPTKIPVQEVVSSSTVDTNIIVESVPDLPLQNLPQQIIDERIGLKLDLAAPELSSSEIVPASTEQPVLIEDTGMAADAGEYLLSAELKSVDEEKVELVPAISLVEEAGLGQMEVKRSTAGIDENIDRLIKEARLLYSGREFSKADEKVLAILKQQPLHVQARLLYASTLIDRRNAGTALQVLDEGLKLDPGISEWANVYARLLINQGQTEQAVEVLTRALPAVGTNDDYYAFYAALLQRLSRHDEASEVYRLLLIQQPDNGLLWMGLAISQDALKSVNEALYSYNKALEGQALNYELRQYVLQQTERLSR